MVKINSDDKEEKGKKLIMKWFNNLAKDGVVLSISELRESPYNLNIRDAKVLHFLLKKHCKKQKSYKFAE